MPKKNKFTGSKYKVGSHPIKSAVNEWIANLTRLVAHPQDKPWALLLESEATLTIKSLTNTANCQPNIGTSDSELSPIIKEENIVIPQPDSDQLDKIKSSYPRISIYPQTSHELLSDLSIKLKDSTGNGISASDRKEEQLASSEIEQMGDERICDINLNEYSKKQLLEEKGWPGWFSLVWLDYCGKVSSGNVSKLRRQDLEMIFSSGMLAGGRYKSDGKKITDPSCNKPILSLLAITMSNRATPLRYPNEQLDLLILHINEVAEKHGYICQATPHNRHSAKVLNSIGRKECDSKKVEEKYDLIPNIAVAGVINYFITTPMTTVALFIGPKISITKGLQLEEKVPRMSTLQDMIAQIKPPCMI